MRAVVVIAAVLLLALPAWAHPQGFHKHVRIVVHEDRVEALVVMDVDGGRRSQLLRAGADKDGNGKLDDAEVERLRAQLGALATSKLKMSFSGHAITLAPEEVKLNLRGDRKTSEAALSVAVLLGSKLPAAPREGMELVVQDTSPDRSHVKVEAEQAVAVPDEKGRPPYGQGELRPGERFVLKLVAPPSL